MSRDIVALARASYKRCLARPDFPRFYRRFLTACPQAAPMFATTDIEGQEKLLRHAIGLLLSVHHEVETEPNVLTRIAERHSQRDLDIDPALYDSFVESLIDVVADFDPEYTPEIGRSWRVAIEPGIRYMKRAYGERHAQD